MANRLAHLFGSLSHALDTAEGQQPGHAQRTCVIAIELARRLGLGETQRSVIYYAALLKDAGCTASSSRIGSFCGDSEIEIRRDRRQSDHRHTTRALAHLFRASRPGAGRARHFSSLLVGGPAPALSAYAIRRERGAEVVRELNLDQAVATAILHIDEHWDGGGHPSGLAGDRISLAGRIVALAQAAETAADSAGPEQMRSVVRERSGSWFDPELVAELTAVGDGFWDGLSREHAAVLEPAEPARASSSELDTIARAFGRIIDAKVRGNEGHAERVGTLASRIGREVGLDEHQCRDLYRAGLLHDLGLLRVPSSILDQPRPLTAEQWSIVRRHPADGHAVLASTVPFSRVATLTATHHERLDGSGYPCGLRADRLGLASRVLQAADVADALCCPRPYRPACEYGAVLGMLEHGAGHIYDRRVVAALAGEADVLAGAADVTRVA